MPLVDVVYDLHSDDAILWLLTFRDPVSGQELRAVSNLEDVVSNGRTFTAFPFEVTLPPDAGDGRPQSLKIQFPNVGRELMEMVRAYSPDQPPTVKLELVLGNSPNTVEKTIDFLQVISANYDALTISFELSMAPIFGRRTCFCRYDDDEFPGLHWSAR